MDPHKRSATIEVINDSEKVLAQGRFSTDHDGYQTMLRLGQQHKDQSRARVHRRTDTDRDGHAEPGRAGPP